MSQTGTLLPAPKITAAIIEAATYSPTAAIVQDADGAVFTLDRLSAAQADDPDLTVLADHAAALDFIAMAGGRVSGGAKMLTALLGQQHARGLL